MIGMLRKCSFLIIRECFQAKSQPELRQSNEGNQNLRGRDIVGTISRGLMRFRRATYLSVHRKRFCREGE